MEKTFLPGGDTDMEILVRIIDKDQPDPELEKMASKRGDVIAICPDGWPWSVAERTNPEWRIIRSPILQTHATTLLTTPISSVVPQKVRRTWKFHLDGLSPTIADKFTGARKDKVIDLHRRIAEAATVKKQYGHYG